MKIETKLKRPYYGLQIILCLTIAFASCEDDFGNSDHLDLPKTFHFAHSDFIGNIECRDTMGQLIETYSPLFIKNDFLFKDNLEYPYESIEIMKDSSVRYYYTLQELTKAHYGSVTIRDDSIYFFVTSNEVINIVYKGYFSGDILKVPAHGYKFHRGDSYNYATSGFTMFGYPDLNYLTNQMIRKKYDKIFIQKFDLIYE